MGIDCEIKKLLRTEIAPRSYHKGAHLIQPTPSQGTEIHVAVIDYLTRFKALDVDKHYSVRELFKSFWSPIETFFKAGYHDVIVVIDDPKGVTKFKAATQAKRVQASKKADDRAGREPIVSYPADAELDVEGQGVTWVQTDGDFQEVMTEGIDLRRLKATKHLGNRALWTLFDHMAETIMLEWHNPHQTFYFDYQTEGAVEYKKSKTTRLYEPHALGEADPSMIWWIEWSKRQYGPGPSVHIHTCDTDFIPLYCLYQESPSHGESSPQVYWHSARDEMFDMEEMMNGLEAKGFNHFTFALGCILGGTDMVNKASYAFGLGPASILHAAKDTYFNSNASIAEYLDSFITQLYHKHLETGNARDRAKYSGTKKDLEEIRRVYEEKGLRVKVPSKEAVAGAVEAIEFNFNYWLNAWRGI